METLAQTQTWTEERLLAVPDDGHKYELVDGEMVMSPTGFEHEYVGANLLEALRQFVRPRKLGVVLGSSLGCWMKNGNCRSPDVSFVRKDRIPREKQAVKKFFQGAPDLVVEILSPSDTVEQMRQKLIEYFESGTRLAWVVNPEDRIVLVYHSPESSKLLRMSDLLIGEDLLPGFTLPLTNLFAPLELD